MAIKVGSKAPDFTLKTKTEEGLADVKLSDNFGKKSTVLFFFPLAFTGVCQEEMCSISNELNQYKELDAAVYGISVDSPFSQEAFAQQANIKVPLLSDFNKTASREYDVLFEDLLGLKGVAKRSAIVINKDGVVTYSESSDNPKQLPDFDKVKAALKN